VLIVSQFGGKWRGIANCNVISDYKIGGISRFAEDRLALEERLLFGFNLFLKIISNKFCVTDTAQFPILSILTNKCN
jgi:hypothetical protein